MWGFIQSILVTAPFSVIGLVESNSAAKEWCARTGTTEASRPRPTTKTVNVAFIANPPDSILTEIDLLPRPAFARRTGKDLAAIRQRDSPRIRQVRTIFGHIGFHRDHIDPKS